MKSLEVLKEYFGYDSFREGQDKLVSNILDNRDVLGIMPTGAGKSICFWVPAIMHTGITIVISPLISLMTDHVQTLVQSGVRAGFINSSLNNAQLRNVMINARNGVYKIIYVAPERLFTDEFLDFAQNTEISMITIDEAHCISQWGQDFRPSYTNIPEFISKLAKRPIISAFTATATSKVSKDILDLLKLNDPKILITGFNRENLYFEVDSPTDKYSALVNFLEQNKEKSGIIYAQTRKAVDEIAFKLSNAGYNVLPYHAGLDDKTRKNNQNEFIFDNVDIMVATNAFGMGIDKSNVSFVVHYNMPKDIESYYQEAGRAGRDGNPAKCLLLYSDKDVSMAKWLIENGKDTTYIDEKQEKILKDREYKRLKEMMFFSTTRECLRGYILKYFGENPEEYCGTCSNCNTKFEVIDITLTSKKILSCIARMGENFGIAMVISVLRGSKQKRVIELGFDKLSTYGICDLSEHTLRNIINYLCQNGYITQTDGEYSVLKLNEKSKEILYTDITLDMKIAKEKITHADKASKNYGLCEKDKDLFELLRKKRQDIAMFQSVPAYVVFADKTLVDMAIRKPKNEYEFLQVSGVGQSKLEKYGEKFIKIINEYTEE